MQRLLAALIVSCLVLFLSPAPGARADDAFSTWHLGVRLGVYQPVGGEGVDFDYGFLGGIFLQSPTLSPSRPVKLEMSAELGFVEGEGDEALEKNTGADVDVEATLVNLRGTLVYFPGLLPQNPGRAEVFLFSGVGWSSQEVDLDLDGRRINLNLDEDESSLFATLGMGVGVALTDRTMLEFRAGYDVWFGTDLGDGTLFVTGGLAF